MLYIQMRVGKTSVSSVTFPNNFLVLWEISKDAIISYILISVQREIFFYVANLSYMLY